ncbi:hypothetical protein ACQEU6_45000 [Spirillospora sp. CA-108201]
MGMDTPSGGPGKGPETPDKPTPPRTDDKPPAEAPGTSDTPRLDSYKAAGQPVPGQPEAGTERRGDREAQPNGSSTDSSSTGPATEKPQTPGDPPSEAEPKTEKEPETGKTEVGSPSGEERDHDDPAQTGDGGPEAEKPGRPKPENPRQDEGERGTDDRGSKTEQPEPGKAEEQDGGRAADDPASSGQPGTRPAEASQFPPGSRRASLAAAREGQLETAEERRAVFQDAQTTNGPGEGSPGEIGDRGAPPQSEHAGSDERGPEAQPQGAETPPSTIGDGDTSSGADGSGDGEGSSGRDQPAPAVPEAEAEPPSHEAPRPQDQEHEPLIPQDSADSGDNSGDPPADASPPADGQTQGGKDGTLPGAEVGQPTEPAAETDPPGPEPGREASPVGPETTDQGTEPPEPKTDDGTGEQSDAHGRNAEGPESIESTDETTPPDREAEQSGEREESDTELAPHEEESTDIEPSRFAGQVTITLDRDGRPVPPDHPDADTETPGRGELRRPEDDRASRDYQERDPDNPTPGKDILRKFLLKAENAKDSGKTFTEPALKNFDRVKPTGQSCAAHPNTDHIKAPDQSIKSGDVLLGAVGTAIVLGEVVRLGLNLARRTRRREHADH